MAARQIHLFATRKDLEPGIRRVEQKCALKYALCGMGQSPEVHLWASLLDVETLGKAAAGNQSLCERYLVLDANAKLYVRRVAQATGGTRFIVDQLENPISIVCQIGGVFDSGFLICGHIGSVSDHPDAVQLFRVFRKSLIDGFQKHGDYFVGPEALDLHRSGVRLITMHVNESTKYDLKVV